MRSVERWRHSPKAGCDKITKPATANRRIIPDMIINIFSTISYLLQLSFLIIFGFDDLVGVAGKVFEQFLFCGVGIHAYPVFGRQVKRFADAVVLGFQFLAARARLFHLSGSG